jgi:hypothetical protein
MLSLPTDWRTPTCFVARAASAKLLALAFSLKQSTAATAATTAKLATNATLAVLSTKTVR